MADPFRTVHRELNDDDKARIVAVKDHANRLHELLNDLSRIPIGQREMALAKTQLEMCVMWAVKGITG